MATVFLMSRYEGLEYKMEVFVWRMISYDKITFFFDDVSPIDLQLNNHFYFICITLTLSLKREYQKAIHYSII